MFNFWPNDTSSSNSKNYLVTPYFWIYWAVTIPLTLLVVVIGKYWMWMQARKTGKERQLLTMERIVVGQNWYRGDATSPMYPNVPSHLHEKMSKTDDVLLF